MVSISDKVLGMTDMLTNVTDISSKESHQVMRKSSYVGAFAA